MFWLDTTILGLIAMGAILGALTGFLRQVARIASLALSIYLAILMNEGASKLLLEAVMQGADQRIARALAYLAVFVVVYLVLFHISALLDQGIRAVNLEPVDRLLGAGVGALKMALLLAAICLGITTFPNPKSKEMMEKSLVAPVLVTGMDAVLVILPPEYKNEFCDSWNQLRELARTRLEQARRPETEKKKDPKTRAKEEPPKNPTQFHFHPGP